MNVVIDAVGEPDFLLIVGERDAVARAAVWNPGPGSDIPFLGPAETLHFDVLDHLAGFHIRDFEAEQIVGIRIDQRSIVVDHEHADVVRELDGLHQLVRSGIGNAHDLAVG